MPPEPRVDPPSTLDTETPVESGVVQRARIREDSFEQIAVRLKEVEYFIGQLGLDVKQTTSLQLVVGGFAAAVEVLR